MMIATLPYSILAEQLTTMSFILTYIIFTIGQGFSSGNSMTNGLRQLTEEMRLDGNAICTTVQQLSGASGTSLVTTMIRREASVEEAMTKMCLAWASPGSGTTLTTGTVCARRLTSPPPT